MAVCLVRHDERSKRWYPWGSVQQSVLCIYMGRRLLFLPYISQNLWRGRSGGRLYEWYAKTCGPNAGIRGGGSKKECPDQGEASEGGACLRVDGCTTGTPRRAVRTLVSGEVDRKKRAPPFGERRSPLVLVVFLVFLDI